MIKMHVGRIDDSEEEMENWPPTMDDKDYTTENRLITRLDRGSRISLIIRFIFSKIISYIVNVSRYVVSLIISIKSFIVDVRLNAVWPIMSIISFIIDFFLDFALVLSYFSSGENVNFRLTLGFMLVPAIVNTEISTRIYFADKDKISKKRWLLRMFFHFCYIAPIIRSCAVLMYSWKSWKAKEHEDSINQHKYYKLMEKEQSVAALMSVIESFLESAPQRVLQLTIILTTTNGASTFALICQWVPFGISIIIMGCSMASYERVKGFAQEDKENITWTGLVMLCLWHSMIVASRILSISLAWVIFPGYTYQACAIHLFIMWVWLFFWERTNLCLPERYSLPLHEVTDIFFTLLLSCTLSCIYIFSCVTPKDRRNGTRYLIYYSICFAENFLVVTACALTGTAMQDKWYFYPLLIGCIAPFVIGIGFMLLYYSCFHPRVQKTKSGDRLQNGDGDLHTSSSSNSSSSAEGNSLSCKPSNASLIEADNSVSGAEVLTTELRSCEQLPQQNGEGSIQNNVQDIQSLLDTEIHQHNEADNAVSGAEVLTTELRSCEQLPQQNGEGSIQNNVQDIQSVLDSEIHQHKQQTTN